MLDGSFTFAKSYPRVAEVALDDPRQATTLTVRTERQGPAQHLNRFGVSALPDEQEALVVENASLTMPICTLDGDSESFLQKFVRLRPKSLLSERVAKPFQSIDLRLAITTGSCYVPKGDVDLYKLGELPSTAAATFAASNASRTAAYIPSRTTT